MPAKGSTGAVAVVALLLYTLFSYAIFVLVPVTFTLPGIAGFILSIGMAVDANVLIYERMRDEARAGRSVIASMDAGFNKAMGTIVDANRSCPATVMWTASEAMRCNGSASGRPAALNGSDASISSTVWEVSEAMAHNRSR